MSRDLDFVAVFERMCADAAIRRELLWLRANEKEDLETVRDLERLEPGLGEHMAELVSEFVTRGHPPETARERRDGFGQLYDERLEYWTRALTAGASPNGAERGRIKV